MFKFTAEALLVLALTTSHATAQNLNDYKVVEKVTHPDIYFAVHAKHKFADTIPTVRVHPFAGWHDCKIDGRDSTMRWTAAVTIEKQCSQSKPQVCQFVHKISKLSGIFSEKRSPGKVATLTLTYDAPGMISMRHSDGNTWNLSAKSWKQLAGGAGGPALVVQATDGNTMWQGQSYPLSCTRRY